MNKLHSTSDNTIKDRLAEADLYHSQGLNEEALLICLELQKLTGDQSHPLHTEVESLLKKIQIDGSGGKVRSGGTDSASGPEDIEEDQDKKFNSCIGLMEAGFYSEAIEELKALNETGYRPGIIQAKIGESYLRLDMPFDALEHLQEALGDPRCSCMSLSTHMLLLWLLRL